MVNTRSNQRKENESEVAGIEVETVTETTTSASGSGTTETTRPPSTARTLKTARSRRSKASSKRLLAELGAKEKLAELELQRIRAEAELESIRLEKLAVEETSMSESEEEVEDLAPQRVADWFQQRTVQQEGAELRHAHEERPRAAAHAHTKHAQPEPTNAHPYHASAFDVASLTVAIAEALNTKKSARTHITELPTFSGQSAEWLQFKAAYNESAPSFSPNENTARIRKSLKGVAAEAVSALLISQPQPEDVMNALERRYGRADALLIHEIEKMKMLPRLTDSPRDLCVFAGRIANTVATIEILKKPQYLYNPEVLRLIVEKLSPILRNKWYDYAATAPEVPELKKIAEFLNREADKCAPYAPPEQVYEARAIKKRPERTYAVRAEQPSTSYKTPQEKPSSSCYICDSDGHQAPTCPQITKADTNARWELAKKKHVCYRCLTSKHRRFVCRAKPCGLNGCPMRHHRLLHHEKPAGTSCNNDPSPSTSTPNEHVVASTIQQVLATTGVVNRAYLKIAPVTLRGPRASLDTFALMDEGSSISIIDASLADTLGLDGPTEPMRIQGVSGKEMSHTASKKVALYIRGKHRDEELQIEAHTVGKLDFATQSITEEEIRGCSHLHDVADELLYENATPKILIGQDNWELIISRGIKQGRRNQLVCSDTLLGWVAHGCRTTNAAPIAYCAHLTRAEKADQIEEMMKQYFSLESIGIEARRQDSDPEVQALKILGEKSRRLPDGRFETGLLWREGVSDIPNNRSNALRRLLTLEKKLDRDADLKRQYSERIDNLLRSNYAERAPAPPSGRTWYLPHFAVCNPEKAHIRVVHDAASKWGNRSLNDMLHSGPDMLQSLGGVIMRFRQYPVAVISDIKEMFMQIKIREEDRDALRFLWRGDRRDGEPDEYRMTSVIFGATSSPCTALYIKNRNAREYADAYPEAARAIERNHYMDDYLQSFPDENEAKKIIGEVDFIHKKAGFILRGWASNRKEIVDEVSGGSERDSTTIASDGTIERDGTTIPIGGSETEKTLGLLWDTQEDCIKFRFNRRRVPHEVLSDLRPPTKREALRLIMSIFDPLGMIAPITTPAKRIMQDTWRFETSWDDEIPAELQERWSNWLQQLASLSNLKIPRCYEESPALVYELHTFVDASEEAYGTCVYWRMTRPDGSIAIALAAAKSRVTPSRPVSIPRLELQAALLGVRLARSVLTEHDFVPARKTYWSDSRTALAWIRAEPRTFRSFVAHRVAEIEDATKKNEWRWVPTSDNVADDCTRATPVDFGSAHRWYHGPSFLYQPESAWPVENKIQITATGEEKEHCNVIQEAEEGSHPHLPSFDRFSKWMRLLRATARVLQFIARLRERVALRQNSHVIAAAKRKRTRANTEADSTWRRTAAPTHTPAVKPRKSSQQKDDKYIVLEAEYIHAAEQLLIRASQEDSFKKEKRRMINNSVPERDDRLIKLSAFIDENDIIRLKGRIAAAEAIAGATVHPVILHGKHIYTKLYIAHQHEKLHHGTSEIVVNELRQRVHIMKIRPAVKDVIARCGRCRLSKAKPATPSTGNLPAARLAHHVRPYTYTGLDYFGPQEVTVGRHREKRYVALFTCMTSRAVHLEVVTSLSTDAAINALRRFIARRGCPTELWSDNATAFRSADRELRDAMKQEATARRINWRFLPPAAPFMAGAWERMVRCVKEALRVTLHEKSPSDETFSTLLAEAEATVNSRPLTHVSVDPADPPALTPNTILLGADCYNPAPGRFEESDMNARQHWRRAQQLADTFWRRWVREYMPLLQQRRDPAGKGVEPAVGDLVIICDSNLPRNTWPRGRVTRTYPGEDHVIRVVEVTTSKGHVLRRPTKKIVVLPVDCRATAGENVHDGNMLANKI